MNAWVRMVANLPTKFAELVVIQQNMRSWNKNNHILDYETRADSIERDGGILCTIKENKTAKLDTNTGQCNRGKR